MKKQTVVKRQTAAEREGADLKREWRQLSSMVKKQLTQKGFNRVMKETLDFGWLVFVHSYEFK